MAQLRKQGRATMGTIHAVAREHNIDHMNTGRLQLVVVKCIECVNA